LYEWIVMAFDLTNVPRTLMRFMLHGHNSFIGKFVVIYFDYILVYNIIHEHEHHLRIVFGTLKNAMLYVNKEKCIFEMSMIDFLGFVINNKRMQMDQEKVKAMQDWPTPKKINEDFKIHGRILPKMGRMIHMGLRCSLKRRKISRN